MYSSTATELPYWNPRPGIAASSSTSFPTLTVPEAPAAPRGLMIHGTATPQRKAPPASEAPERIGIVGTVGPCGGHARRTEHLLHRRLVPAQESGWGRGA